MSLKEANNITLAPIQENRMEVKQIANLSQFQSIYWGAWGKERYTYDQNTIKEKQDTQRKIFLTCAKEAPHRLQLALNYTFGLCDLNGYSAPISQDEFEMLSDLYDEAVTYAHHTVPDQAIQFLIRELYCIRKSAESIPNYSIGQLVNETNDPSIHRKYVYLDFFKFSLINILIRFDCQKIDVLSSSELASHLTLAWFVGVGSFIEKSSTLFSSQAFEIIKNKCRIIQDKIEEFLEYPRCEYTIFREDFEDLVLFIETEKRIGLEKEEIVSLLKTARNRELQLCNDYYTQYFNSPPEDIEITNPLNQLKNLSAELKKKQTPDVEVQKKMLRALRTAIDTRYSDDREQFKNYIRIKDFFSLTTHPYFRALLYEGEILSQLYAFENQNDTEAVKVQVLLLELTPFFSCKYQGGSDLFKTDQLQIPTDLPKLVLAHHVHNANCNKLRDMMIINRLIHWPLEKQVLTISSSSSKPEIVKRERDLCRDLGFNHYRIHARQHLKAGNQNRAVFNAIDCQGPEYYLTLDDDYFVFPDFPFVGHQQIVNHNLDYYQAPLAFKGVYKIGVTNGERTDAEILHYFESTSGTNKPRTYVFPRGTGTIFSFNDSVSSIGDTGGFLIGYSSEDFGQGFLSLFQEYGVYGKKNHSKNMGKMSPTVMCIGEGVDLSGKLMQAIRWNQGTTKLYFHIFIPAIISSIFKRNFEVLTSKQIFRIGLFIPVGVLAKLLSVLIFCLPFLSYIMFSKGIYLFTFLKNETALLLFGNMFLLAASIIHYGTFQRRFSFSPFRMYFMDIFIMTSASYGYIMGIFAFKSKWLANKTGKIKWGQYTGPFSIFLLNALIVPLAWKDGYTTTAYWSLANASTFLIGFFYFNSKENYSQFYKKIPVKLWSRLSKALGIISFTVFIAYIVTVIQKMQSDFHQQFLFLLFIFYMLNMYLLFGIASTYIFKDDKIE